MIQSCLWRRASHGLFVLCFVAGCASQPAGTSTQTIDSSASPEAQATPWRIPLTPRPPVEYQDVYPIALGGTYLTNPGMGWQQDAESQHPDLLPETVAYGVRHHIGWNTLNPADGVYDWSALDAELEQAVAQGKQYSFRVQTMAGGNFGGAKLPDWVLEAGAVLMPSGAPDYSNCIYQEKWAAFVDRLIARYDGNLNIAYIDISGYGDFNEWSWGEQTHWDGAWESDVTKGVYDPAAFQSLDGQARRRLADMFIGGAFQHHACRDRNDEVHYVDYSYRGFQRTQLLMPYGGIRQSTQYVASRRRDVGFRFDCLGGESPDRVIAAAGETWRSAPVVFELCQPEAFSLDVAHTVLTQTHGSLVHDNYSALTPAAAQDLMLRVGYRYVLRSARLPMTGAPGEELRISMDWLNTGTSPAYARMGQDFRLHFYLVGQNGQTAVDQILPTDISTWMPADTLGGQPPDYLVDAAIGLSPQLPVGVYKLAVEILDHRTGLPISLGFGTPDAMGRYPLATVTVGEGS